MDRIFTSSQALVQELVQVVVLVLVLALVVLLFIGTSLGVKISAGRKRRECDARWHTPGVSGRLTCVQKKLTAILKPQKVKS